MIKRTIISTTLFLLSLYSGTMYAQCVCEHTTDPTTPINKAFLEIIENNNFTYAFELLESQANPNIVNECGAGLLMFSAFDDRVKLASKLLSLNANPNIQNHHGDTPVFIAAQWSSNEVLSMLLEAGGNPNPDIPECAKDNLDNNPLFTAAINDNIEGVKILLRHGADYLHSNINGATAFDYLIFRNDSSTLFDIIESIPKNQSALKQDIANEIIFLTSAIKGAELKLEYLLSKSFNPNFSVDDEAPYNTPLLIAALAENIESVKMLIKHGADVNYVNKHGYSIQRIIEDKNIDDLFYLFE